MALYHAIYERNRHIYALRTAGWKYRTIAQVVGLSVERTRQIVVSETARREQPSYDATRCYCGPCQRSRRAAARRVAREQRQHVRRSRRDVHYLRTPEKTSH
jgi:hypothetical protein